MRAFLAATILMLGLYSAVPEPEYVWLTGENLHSRDGGALPSPVEIESMAHRSDRLAIAAVEDSASSQDSAGLETGEPESSASPSISDIAPDQAASLDDLCSALLMSAQDNDLPVPFFANLIWQESRLRDDAVSPVGALGIAQFMPKVAMASGLDNPFDPRQAIPASARLLRELRAHFGNLGYVAAAYNAGARRVSEWLARGRALPHETRDYVLRVTGRSAEQWRTTPPVDAALTFVRHLPCRSMPAYADLEQAQAQMAEAEQAPTQTKPAEDQKAKTAQQTVNFDHGALRHRRDQNHSLAKAWQTALHIADSEPTAGRHHPRHERQASNERSKSEKKLAELRVGRRKIASHHASTHRA
jgi:soluble lytic murein transglycosylase-like protein